MQIYVCVNRDYLTFPIRVFTTRKKADKFVSKHNKENPYSAPYVIEMCYADD